MPRKTTPTKLKIVKGETRPSRINDAEPEPTGDLPSPPRRLAPAARAVWKRDAPFWATEADASSFARYCRAEADADRFYAVCEDEGWWIEGSRGTLVIHPAARLYEQSHLRADRLAAEFGMTPSSRSKVRAMPPKRKPKDPGAEFD